MNLDCSTHCHPCHSDLLVELQPLANDTQVTISQAEQISACLTAFADTERKAEPELSILRELYVLFFRFPIVSSPAGVPAKSRILDKPLAARYLTVLYACDLLTSQRYVMQPQAQRAFGNANFAEGYRCNSSPARAVPVLSVFP